MRRRPAVRFEDTDRWVRGRVVAALAAGEELPAIERRAPGTCVERHSSDDGLVQRDVRRTTAGLAVTFPHVALRVRFLAGAGDSPGRRDQRGRDQARGRGGGRAHPQRRARDQAGGRVRRARRWSRSCGRTSTGSRRGQAKALRTRRRRAGRARPRPRRRRARRRRPGAAAKEATSADVEGARLIALNMALNGESREATDEYLAENFDLGDRSGAARRGLRERRGVAIRRILVAVLLVLVALPAAAPAPSATERLRAFASCAGLVDYAQGHLATTQGLPGRTVQPTDIDDGAADGQAGRRRPPRRRRRPTRTRARPTSRRPTTRRRGRRARHRQDRRRHALHGRGRHGLRGRRARRAEDPRLAQAQRLRRRSCCCAGTGWSRSRRPAASCTDGPIDGGPVAALAPIPYGYGKTTLTEIDVSDPSAMKVAAEADLRRLVRRRAPERRHGPRRPQLDAAGLHASRHRRTSSRGWLPRSHFVSNVTGTQAHARLRAAATASAARRSSPAWGCCRSSR